MSAQQNHLRMTLARPANPLARPGPANHRRMELARRSVLPRIPVTPLAQVAVAPVVPPAPAPASVARVRVPRIHHCSFCFSNNGHNIGACTHIDVEYLYWEMMYFYQVFGEHFLCNNLSVLFEPTEVHALVNYRLIKIIPLVNETDMWERMVVDVMHSPVISARYEKLHKKIISMGHNPNSRSRLDYGRMDIVEPILYDAIQLFEHEFGERLNATTIITGYHHTFTRNRHARFRRYDYDVEYMDSIPINPRELRAFRMQYNPPSMFGECDMGRYGFARMRLVTMESMNFTTPVAEQPESEEEEEDVGTPTEPPPEWMMGNVTQRRGAATFTFEDMAFITRLFEDTLKNAQPETEVKIVEESSEKMEECLECPICMVEIKHSESVSLGCCVYSFCSDCYVNQYLTKEHRAHNCMMCRTPFSKIEVYETAISEKLKAKFPASIVQEEYYYPDNLPERTRDTETEYYGLPMTLAELL